LEAVYESSADAQLLADIQAIIETEAPIAEETLSLRLAAAWGVKRIIGKWKSRVEALMPEGYHQSSRHGSVFIWKSAEQENLWREYRRCSSSSDLKRKWSQIPPEEMANAMWCLIENYLSLPQEELFKETANQFGYNQLNQKAREAVAVGFQVLMERNEIEMDGAKVKKK
jgi:hypothetical protein